MLIRRELPKDVQQVHDVQSSAFGQPLEADLVTALRSGGHAIDELALVAEVDGQVVGHVVCSRGAVADTPSVGLGPIGVLPEFQTQGIGSALMHAIIGAADALGEPLIALLGSPDYYQRFGFRPSAEAGITAPDPDWKEFFQVRTLAAFNTGVTGEFRYATPFDNL